MFLTAHGLAFNITPTGRFFGKQPDPDDIKTDIRLVGDSGFVGYELWVEKLTAFLDAGGDVQELVDLLKETGVRAPAFCFVGDFPDMGIHTAEPKRATQLFTVLAALGCDVAIHVPDPHNGLDRDEAMKRATATLQGVADIAVDHGIKLAAEFIYTMHYLKNVNDTLELLERCDRDNVGISLDTFHFYMGGSQLADIERIPQGGILGLHVNSCPDGPKENLTDKDRLPPGLGVLPVAEILDACRARGYDAHLSIEILHDDYWKMDAQAALQKMYDESADACARWL